MGSAAPPLLVPKQPMVGGGRPATGASLLASLAISVALWAQPALGLRQRRGGEQPLHAPVSNQGKEQGTAVVHFLFLLRSSLPHAEIWRRFFADAPAGSWAAWAHCTDRAACVQDSTTKAFPLTIVPQVPSKWLTDLVTPEVRLLRSATEPGVQPRPALEKFVILSDSTLPVKPFSVVSKVLSESPDSDFCFNTVNQWSLATIRNKTYTIPKHWQWVVFNRTDALGLIRRWQKPIEKDTAITAWNVTLPDGTVVPRSRFSGSTRVPDEQVFSVAEGPLELTTRDRDAEMQQILDRLRRCRTYLTFNKDMELYRKLHLKRPTEPRIDVTYDVMDDAGSKWDGPRWDRSHPIRFTQVGKRTTAALRNSPFLFARKFKSGALPTPEQWARIFFSARG